jgi:hypothetical protein
MAVDDLYSLADKDLAQDRERGEYGRESRRSIDDPMREMVDFQTIREISHTRASRTWWSICVSDDNHIMAAIDQFLRVISTLSNHETRMILFAPSRCQIWFLNMHILSIIDRCDSLHLQAADRRNPRSYFFELVPIILVGESL